MLAFTALFAQDAVPNKDPVIDPDTFKDPVKKSVLSLSRVKLPLPLNNPPLLYCREYRGPFGDPLPLLTRIAFTVTVPFPSVGDKVTLVPAMS